LGILEVCKKLSPKVITGTLICLPALNISAFREERRSSLISKYGVPDLNRVFPGKEDGNFTEIMAHNLFQTFIKNADYLIDLHTGHNPDTLWTLYSEDGPKTAKKCNELARAFGLELIYPCKSEVLKNAFSVKANQKGKPGIIVEAGGSGALANSEAVSAVVDGIMNVMKFLRMLHNPFVFKDSFIILKDWTWIMAPRGGRFVPTVKIRETVRKRQIIARMYTIFNEELEPIKTPMEGIILTVSKMPFVTAGDSIFQIGRP
jgi:predicted deacylase